MLYHNGPVNNTYIKLYTTIKYCIQLTTWALQNYFLYRQLSRNSIFIIGFDDLTSDSQLNIRLCEKLLKLYQGNEYPQYLSHLSHISNHERVQMILLNERRRSLLTLGLRRPTFRFSCACVCARRVCARLMKKHIIIYNVECTNV